MWQKGEETFEAEDVRLVAEVLSPSTREFDMFQKLDEYRDIPTMQYVLLIEPNAPKAILWSRHGATNWSYLNLGGLDSVADMPSLGLQMALGEICRNLTFRSSPKLVEGGEG